MGCSVGRLIPDGLVRLGLGVSAGTVSSGKVGKALDVDGNADGDVSADGDVNADVDGSVDGDVNVDAAGDVVNGVNAGFVSPGLVKAGFVKPGSVRVGDNGDNDVDPSSVPKPGVVRPGVVRPGVVNPGPVWMGCVPAGLKLPGKGGRLNPNCDSPWVSADINSLGRSVVTAAGTKSRCSEWLVRLEVRSMTLITANGLATASAATALMVVDRVRRR